MDNIFFLPTRLILSIRNLGLIKLGYSLRKLEHDNYLVEKHGSVIIKNNYWFWKENQSAGNAIDFFVIVEKRSFLESMAVLMEKK